MGQRALDMFETVTAVSNGSVPRDALPTGAIEPVIEIHHGETSQAIPAAVAPMMASTPEGDDLLVAVDPALAAELAATVGSAGDAGSAAAAVSVTVDSGVATETAGTIDAALAAYSASTVDSAAAMDAAAANDAATANDAAGTTESVAASDGAALLDTAAGNDSGAVLDAVAVESELSTRLTERMPELSDALSIARRFSEPASIAALPLRAAVTDKIARARGLPPISEPYVRERERVRVARGWFYAALAIAIAALVASASVVMWARGEVRRARDAEYAPLPPLVAAKVVSETVAPIAPRSTVPAVPATPSWSSSASAADAPSAAAVEAPAPPSCFVRVTSTVRGAIVLIEGQRAGGAPTEVPVACGHETAIEVRRARYQSFRSAVVVPDGTVVIHARLERRKRRH